MDGPPPPPPPPHGEKPNTTHGEYRKASDLPPGPYDIFVIPSHSAGAGFLYLPSLQCHQNSFIAGCVCTLFVVLLWFTLLPVLKTWYSTTIANNSGMGMALLAIAVGVAGWAFGASQSDSGARQGPGFGGFGSGSGPGAGGAHSSQNQSSGTSGNYSRGSTFGGPHGGQNYRGGFAGGPRPGNQYGNQHAGPPPHAHPGSGPPPKDSSDDWDRAREETRRKEEIRRKMEEFKRKREAEAREKQRQQERDEMEREFKARQAKMEREIAEAKARAEKEARERAEKAAAEAEARREKLEKEAKEKQERAAAEAKEKADKEAAEKKAAAQAAAKKEAEAKFAAFKRAAAQKYEENRTKDGQGAASSEAGSAARASRTPSPKKPPFPTARTALDDDAYSFRPYDRPRRPYGTSGSSVAESSYAPSQSTAPTTPPPSHKGGYSTKDPDKIVIRGVYSFNNAFLKTPIAHLVSGQGMVTDGLVLRITTEGLFIDDDLRGVPQREWDVKAWTLKLAEVWCPQVGATQTKSPPKTNPFRWSSSHTAPSSEESDACLANLLKVCKNTCRLATPGVFSRNGSTEQRGLHVLRASLRDQEGKRYVFVLQETEGWKVAIGLQRLRKGTQVRALGVSNMSTNDCKSVLGNLGYT